MSSNQPLEPLADILVVDDVISNLRLLSVILTEQGYYVRKAINGQMALIAVSVKPPDLILLDINMPELSGFEICERLKANPATQEIPIIFISAQDDVRDKSKARDVGGVDYITKPFKCEKVLESVNKVLNRMPKKLYVVKQSSME